MIADLMVLMMTCSKSWNASLSVVFSIAASPSPSMNARTSAVMTFIIGGIVTVK